MIKPIILLFLIVFTKLTLNDQGYVLIAIQPNTKNARFGDCLTLIYISLYLSEKFNVSTIYDNFVDSNQLEIQNIINEYKKINFINFKKVKIKSVSQINLNTNQDIIYLITMDQYHIFDAQKNNEQIRTQFKKLIRPIKEIKSYCKNDCINIALHIRKGGGFDLPLLSKDGLDTKLQKGQDSTDANLLAEYYKKNIFFYSDQRWPLKFPPGSFYVQQIKKIITLHPKDKIHVHIFTDDLNPKKLAQKYIKVISNKNVSFSYRTKNNHHCLNITDDFFAMSQFDYLIRPCSTYSQMAQILGKFKMVISPKHAYWIEKNLLFVDQVNLD